MKGEAEAAYRWVPQQCPICEVPPTKYPGRRGGGAHRQNSGVECKIWSCGTCGLIFPNPMPVPLGGLEQHYEVPPEEYFHHHEERRSTWVRVNFVATVAGVGNQQGNAYFFALSCIRLQSSLTSCTPCKAWTAVCNLLCILGEKFAFKAARLGRIC